MQDEAEVGIFLCRFGAARNNGGGALIPTHCVNGKYDWKREGGVRVGQIGYGGRHVMLSSSSACVLTLGLGRVVFQINFFGHWDDFIVVIVTACRADVVGAFQLTTVGAFVGIRGRQAVVGAAVVAARFRHFVLLHSHWNGPLRFGQSRAGRGCMFQVAQDRA